MLIGIVSDCQDANAVARIQFRTASLIPGASFAKPIGVASDIEAAGNIVDLLDASLGQEGVIMVNVAPRHGGAKRHENGSPFGYFFYKKALVIATLDGLTLSLAKQLGVVTRLHRVDIPAVLAEMTVQSKISRKEGAHIAASQFRSFEFAPYLAAWILQSTHFPKEEVALAEIPRAPADTVWWIDRIEDGDKTIHNCKLTTVAPRGLTDGQRVCVHVNGLHRDVSFFHRLRDVPNEKAAVIQGSSGFERHRFLELVVNGGDAAKHFGVVSGDELTLEFPPVEMRRAAHA